MTYKLDDFADLPEAPKLVSSDTLTLGELPSMVEVMTSGVTWSDRMRDLYKRDAEWFSSETMDRSRAMSSMAFEAAEQGWSDEQIAALVYDVDDKWGKYVGRVNRDTLLIDLVNRARDKIGYVQIDPTLPNLTKQLLDAELVEGDEQEPGLSGVFKWFDFTSQDFPVNWLVDDLLPVNGLGFLVGSPGVGKTQLCLNFGVRAATGRPFFQWPVSKPLKVLFLSLEMAAPSIHKFMKKVQGSVDAEHADTLQENFDVVPIGVPVHMDTAEGQTFLKTLLKFTKPDVVLIDSLQKIVSKEMTDESAMKTLFTFLQQMRVEYNCSMVMVHHNRKKSNERIKNDEAELDNMYGSTFIGAEADFALSLRKIDNGLLQLDAVKIRLGDEPPPLILSRDKNTLTFTSHEETDLQRTMEGIENNAQRTTGESRNPAEELPAEGSEPIEPVQAEVPVPEQSQVRTVKRHSRGGLPRKRPGTQQGNLETGQ